MRSRLHLLRGDVLRCKRDMLSFLQRDTPPSSRCWLRRSAQLRRNLSSRMSGMRLRVSRHTHRNAER